MPHPVADAPFFSFFAVSLLAALAALALVSGVLSVRLSPRCGFTPGRGGDAVQALARNGQTFQPSIAPFLGSREPADALPEREEIRAIVRHGTISVWLQPIVNLRTGAILGYEALARGPEGSRLFEARELFQAAERAGLAAELESLCRTKALQAKRESLAPGERIFVNVDPCLPLCAGEAPTCRLTDEMGLRPEEVVLEVTERHNVLTDPRFREELLRCRLKGYRLALDDLGVGFSNLQTLLTLRPDYVKVDASLVRDMDVDPQRAGLLRLLVIYARSNGFSLVAEGIETPAVLVALRRLGVEFGQGFLLGRPSPVPAPVPPEAITIIRHGTD